MALPAGTWNVLACPACGAGVSAIGVDVCCRACDIEYGRAPHGALDLRLRRPKRCRLTVDVGTPLLPDGGFDFAPLRMNPEPAVDFSATDAPHHLTRELMSFFPKAPAPHSLALDIGCGDAIHRGVCERAGFDYIGLDYDAPQAPMLADAHALPFRDESFDFVLSIAVLEHIRFPLLMMREAHRVLKPGGKFIGTVAFLEPFHGDSYYHHTHLGTFNALKHGGFEVEKIAPSADWTALRAQASMSLFPKMPRMFSSALVWPTEILHRLWWSAASLVSPKADALTRIRSTTGAFSFVASRRENP